MAFPGDKLLRPFSCLFVLLFLPLLLPGCASQYQSDLQWCQERYSGYELESCYRAAERRAQRQEMLERRR